MPPTWALLIFVGIPVIIAAGLIATIIIRLLDE